VLSLLFDALSVENDSKSLDQYVELRMIMIRCVRLLKALAKDNDLVQRRIYDRMDLLLRVKGFESEIALLLQEVINLLNEANQQNIYFMVRN